MTVIRYSAARLLGLAASAGGLAALWLWMLLSPDTFMNVHGRYGLLVQQIAGHAWLSGTLFALCFAGAAVFVTMMVGDRTALAMRPDGIEVRTRLGRYVAGWDRVARIDLESANKLAASGECLVIRLRQESGEKILRLPTALLEHSHWEIERQLDAIGRPGVGAGAPAAVESETASGMDYDAVIARHLAARDQAGTMAATAPATFARPAGLQPARGGFGRKGL